MALTFLQQEAPSKLATATEVTARIVKVIPTPGQALVVLELKESFPQAQSLSVRTTSLSPRERLIGIGYTGGKLRFADGHFDSYVPAIKDSPFVRGVLAGFATAETNDAYDVGDRFALYTGASGGPLFDCAGHVVGVFTRAASIDVTVQTSDGPREAYTSTEEGVPNNLFVPTRSLLPTSLRE